LVYFIQSKPYLDGPCKKCLLYEQSTATSSQISSVNYLRLNDVGFSLPQPNLLILLWISRGSASVRVPSRPYARMFLAALISLSKISPQFGHTTVRTERSFSTVFPHPEHFCSFYQTYIQALETQIHPIDKM